VEKYQVAFRDKLLLIGVIALILIIPGITAFAKATGSLYVTVTPSEAEVYIDGKFIGKASPSLFVQEIDSGQHTLRIAKTDYEIYKEQIIIIANEVTKLQIHLTRQKGTITVLSEPIEASVHLDGSYKGKTPLTIKDVDVGTHQIVIAMKGYALWVKEILVSSKKVSSVEAKLIVRTLEISSEPSGANVYINEELKGKTPLKIKFMKAGSYTVKWSAENCLPVWDHIRITHKQQKLSLHAHMQEIISIDLQAGLRGEYYNLSQFDREPSKFPKKPDLIRMDKNIDFNWKEGSPDPVISPDYFGVRWTGFIYIPTPGTYKFKVWRDRACWVWFDNKLIFDAWLGWNINNWIDFEYCFEEAGWHPLKLEFYEREGKARITLKWQPPGENSFEVIPSSCLKIPPKELRTLIDSTIITMNGRHEKGIPTGIILEPGQSAKVSYISGRITYYHSLTTDESAPIWGLPIEKIRPEVIPKFPYAKKGIWPFGVLILLGPVGTDLVYSFQKDNDEVVVKNTTSKSQEIRLFYHDFVYRGLFAGGFSDNEGKVNFLVKKLPTERTAQ